MAIYKIFPIKDTTLYSQYPSANTGLDEILEISTINDGSTLYTSRPLLQFSQTELEDLVLTKANGKSWQANLRLFLAYASNIPLDYSIYCYPVAESWNMGTGHYQDSPIVTNGASWGYRTPSSSWTTSSFSTYVTASYISTQVGGGSWYTGSSTLNPVATQSFDYTTSKDISINVTNTVNLFTSGSIPNNGFILKKDTALEYNLDLEFQLRYFSIDTHTIFPPCLEFKWDDYSTVLTGSLSSSILTDPNFVLTLPNNVRAYNINEIKKFRVNARPKYPTRTFSTSSIYTANYFLPTSSYWSIRDLDTNEIIVDFDNTYTKISADDNGNYFTLYMNGLEPERYYKFLIKTVIDNQTIISDDSYFFKVING